MKAVSLWQPWASAMPLGWKGIETRHWSTAYRGPIAIHAAKRWTREEREFWQEALGDPVMTDVGTLPQDYEPPLGVIVATANLVTIKPTELLLHHGITEREQSWGNYGPDRFGWVFEDIVALLAPIPFKGAQGLFYVPDDVFGPGYVPPPAPAPPPVPPPKQGSLW